MLNMMCETEVKLSPTLKPWVVGPACSSFQDIIWLAGRVFLWRDFVEKAGDSGLRAVFAASPYGDLTCKQRATFTAAFYHPALRAVVAQWWHVYDAARAAGDIPQTGFWRYQASSFRAITWLAGHVFLWRDFVRAVDSQGVDTICTLCPYDDLTTAQRVTFGAAFHHPALRLIVAQWWHAYDAARASGEIPQAGYWR